MKSPRALLIALLLGVTTSAAAQESTIRLHMTNLAATQLVENFRVEIHSASTGKSYGTITASEPFTLPYHPIYGTEYVFTANAQGFLPASRPVKVGGPETVVLLPLRWMNELAEFSDSSLIVTLIGLPDAPNEIWMQVIPIPATGRSHDFKVDSNQPTIKVPSLDPCQYLIVILGRDSPSALPRILKTASTTVPQHGLTEHISVDIR